MASDDFQERLRRIGEKSASKSPAPEFEQEPEVVLAPKPSAKPSKKAPVHVGARISPTMALLGFGGIAVVGMAAALTFGKLTPDSVAINQDVVKEEKPATPMKMTDLFSTPEPEEPVANTPERVAADNPETAN